MSHTHKFIEDAVMGGFIPNWLSDENKKTKDEILQGLVSCQDEIYANYYGTLDAILSPLLIPKAWQAVGKTRGWREHNKTSDSIIELIATGWKHEWHSFIDHLADGLTIEDALGKITN